MSTLLGCLFEPATDFTGSSMTLALSACLGCAFALTNQSRRVYCLNALLNYAVFGSTILSRCGGGHMTCLVAAHFAASFHIVINSIFQLLFGKQLDSLWNTLRGKASMLAEPLEDFYILICPFVPFGTCSWGSQLHTAIITVWHFILIVGQYVMTSWGTECFPCVIPSRIWKWI